MKDPGQALRQCALFSSFEESEIAALGQSAQLFSAAPGEILFREGEAGDFLVVIATGNVRIVSESGPGREQTLALLGPGDSLGEMSLLDGQPRSATAVVSRPSTLIRIGRSDLDALRRRFPDAESRLLASGLRLASDRLRAANTRFLELARLGLEARTQIDQMRSQILSLVSHELRTPLAVIKTSAQILRRGSPPADRQQDFIEKIERQSERLRLLVDDLITLSLLQARPWVQQASEFDALDLTEEVVEGLKEKAAEKELRFATVRRSPGARISADRALLSRAIHHLVENALKFSPPASEVRVEAEAISGGGVRVSVLDRGPGIPPEARERIFQPFAQEQDPLTREVEGMGIGLTLARQVVMAHGGRLTLDSEPGRGSRFTIELPSEPGGMIPPGP